jgi:GNAT superfamily N-acetyltransferase
LRPDGLVLKDHVTHATATPDIRQASAHDVPVILAILRAAFSRYAHEYTSAGYDATVLDAPRMLRRLHEGPVWIARLDAKDVGTVSAKVEPGYLLVRGMAVIPSGQGMGAGKRLLAAAISYGRDSACRCVRLHTTPFLYKAIRLYTSMGFTPTTQPAPRFFGTMEFEMRLEL